MKKKTSRVLSVFLFVLMLISVIPITTSAITENEHFTDVPEGYIGVYTKDDLYEIRTNLSGKYILMNDIIFDESDFVKGGGFYNSGKGWESIGTSETPFTGVFNGNYYTIKNLYINTTLDFAGLFGYCSNATIEKLRLEKATICGGNNTGGIVAYIYHGSVLRCSFDGTIVGDKYVGGIVGQAYTTRGAVISYCESYGSITGTTFVGGILGCHSTYSTALESGRYRINYCVNAALVRGNASVGGILGRIVLSRGYNNYGYYIGVTSTINQCINTGDVMCSGDYVGGIIGEVNTETYVASEQKVDNCYNTGNIFANGYAGGIIGYYTYDTVYQVNVIVNSSYSVGKVTANNNLGGCFGKSPITVNYCYYLEDAVTDADFLTGIAKSDDQLRKKGTFEQWDFDTIWTMEGREDYPYPELRDVPLIFPDELNHEHEYSSEITTPATHLTEGVMTYTCTCGDSYTESIAKTTEHTYNTIVTAPTCTDRGFTLYYCACNDFYMADYVAANGHSHNAEITTPATHLTEGVMTYTCACGDSYTEAIEKTAGHTYSAVVTEPTCTAKGYTTYTCECGDSFIDDYTDALEHNYEEAVTKPATHTEEGIKTFTCDVCGDAYTEAIEKTAEHSHVGAVTTPATHTAEGVMTYTCACGDSYTEAIEKTAEHSHVGAVTTPATHTAEGVMTYTCACGDTYTEAIAKTTEHEYSAVVTAPTCTDEGYTTYTCVCGHSYVGNITGLSDHKDADGDEFCDYCDEYLGSEAENNCSHMCHKSGFVGFIWKIVKFFWKLFSMNPVCECGAAHY